MFADPLSRVWEGGKYDPTAMDDFATACTGVGILEGMREVVLDDSIVNQLVFQKRGTEVGTLLEQLTRMVTVADRPMQPTVLWDSKCDVPLEHCLKELPLQTKDAAEAAEAEAEAEAAAETEAAAEANPAEHVTDESSSQQQQQLLQPDQWLAGGVNSLQELGTAQVAVWDVNQHREANAEAIKEWQAAVDVRFYTAAPQSTRKCPEARTSTAKNQAGFTQGELDPLMEQRHWWKSRPTLTTICYGILGSTMGWIAEGFEFTAGSEVEPWCVDHASRLFPKMKQLGDLEALSADSVEPSAVLIVGTTLHYMHRSQHSGYAERTGRHQDGTHVDGGKMDSQGKLQGYGV